jgi:hypothetical protein
MFKMHKAPAGFRSTYKGVPIYNYEAIKQFIDFTKYYVVFRGPRPHRSACSTRKRDAYAFDVYEHSKRDMERNRIEREAFLRGVKWADNNQY